MTVDWRAWTVGVVFCASAASAAEQGELIERTLAIVGGQAITLSDARAAVALRLIETPAAADPVAAATQRLIERALVLREVQRFAPPEPSDGDIEARIRVTAARYGNADEFRAALAAVGFSEPLLRAWVRDDLRIAAYLDQRFAAAGVPSDEEVSAFYTTHRDDYQTRGESLDQAAPVIRTQLAAERRAELIADWIADLRRRTPVVELIKDR